MDSIDPRRPLRPIFGLALVLALGAGCPAEDDDGDDAATSLADSGDHPTGGSDATAGDDAPTSGDDSGLDPSCAGLPEAVDGSSLSFGGWEPELDIDWQGRWEGACTVTAVAAGSTSLDCSADPDGPASVVATWMPADTAPTWQVDDAVDVAYHRDDWSEGEYFAMRTSADDALLLALGYGGGDGGLPYLDDFIGPISYDEDLDACGMPGEGQRFPAQITFTGEDGTAHPMMQGDAAVLGAASGSSYQVTLHTAESGDFESDHFGSFYDVVIQRLP